MESMASEEMQEYLNRDGIVQAVVLYDTFEDEFLPLSNDIPLALLPLINKPLVDHTLDSLAFGGVEEVFLFCCRHSEAVKAHIENRFKQGIIDVKIIVSESCLSYGDCLRDLNARGLLRGHFILVDPGTISTVKVLPIILKEHKEQTNKDKGTAMTLVYHKDETGCLGRCPSEDIFIAYDENSKKVLFHKRTGLSNDKGISLPEHIVPPVKYEHTTMESDLQDTHIAICSPAVLQLFTDNLDFQTKDDFIKGLLTKETLGSTIYLHIVQNGQFGGAVTNWRNYQTFTCNLVNHNPCNPIRPRLENLKILNQDVYVLRGVILPEDTEAAQSVIGKNVKIGKNVRIENSIVMDNVSIGDSVVITDSIIGPSCTMESECSVTRGSVLGKGVVIAGGKSIEARFLQATAPNFCDNKDILGEKAYVVQYEGDDKLVRTKKRAYKLLVKGEETEEELLHGFSDIKTMFVEETIKSLTRGFEEQLPCADVISEVNSSRYAYINATAEQVNFNVTKAVLLSSLRLHTGQQSSQYFVSSVKYFTPILKNYIRDEETMRHALEAFKEVSWLYETIKDKWIVVVLKYFYEKDLISRRAVIEWYKRLEKEPFQVQKGDKYFCNRLDETNPLLAHVKPFADSLKDGEEVSSEESSEQSAGDRKKILSK